MEVILSQRPREAGVSGSGSSSLAGWRSHHHPASRLSPCRVSEPCIQPWKVHRATCTGLGGRGPLPSADLLWVPSPGHTDRDPENSGLPVGPGLGDSPLVGCQLPACPGSPASRGGRKASPPPGHQCPPSGPWLPHTSRINCFFRFQRGSGNAQSRY